MRATRAFAVSVMLLLAVLIISAMVTRVFTWTAIAADPDLTSTRR